MYHSYLLFETSKEKQRLYGKVEDGVIHQG